MAQAMDSLAGVVARVSWGNPILARPPVEA